MIPILYDKDETDFTGNGLGRLRDCTSCMVTEERNGIYECDFDVPVDGAHFSDIQIGRIVGVTHEDSDDIQPFDIVSYTRPIDGVVTFHCTHISYRQNKLTAISSSTISSLSQAFVLCKAGSFPAPNPFSYWSDIAGSGYFPLADGLPHSVRSMLGGTEGSILDTYGGEYEFDKFNVRLWASRGQERDFTIRYGVNMTDFNDDTDLSETYNAVIPYWASSDDKVVGSMVTSGFTVTGRTECVPLDVSDKFEDKPTQADVEAMAQSIMSAQEPTKPQKNITVSFLRLQDLPEYQDFADIMTCKLCDTINVVFPDAGQSRFKIVKTVWNVLENRYDEMELGALSTTLSEALGITNSVDSREAPLVTLFDETEVTLVDNASISAGGYSDGTAQLSRTGYYPLGVIGWYSTTRFFCNTRCYIYSRSGNTATLGYMVYNPDSSARTGTAKAYILWLKTS